MGDFAQLNDDEAQLLSGGGGAPGPVRKSDSSKNSIINNPIKKK